MSSFNPYTPPSSEISISEERKNLGVRKESFIAINAALLMTFLFWLPYAITILVNWHLNQNEGSLSFLTYQVLFFRATGEFINSYFYLVIPILFLFAFALRFIYRHANKPVIWITTIFGIVYILSFPLLLLTKKYGLGFGVIGVLASFYYYAFSPSVMISSRFLSPKKDYGYWLILLFFTVGITMFEIGNWIMWQQRSMSH